jgi:type IV pilus assembly protein PilV
MVEVLVALIVLSIGLLGMAGLYVTTLRSGTGSIYRMQAVYLASSIADRIRANRNVTTTSTNGYAGVAVQSDCIGATCVPSTMAANDLAVWNNEIARLLPATSTGTVTYAPALFSSTTNASLGIQPPATYTVTLTWQDPGSTTNQTYTLVTQI